MDIIHVLQWESPRGLRKYWLVGMVGYDKEGCPVWLTEKTRVDLKGRKCIIHVDIKTACTVIMELNGPILYQLLK